MVVNSRYNPFSYEELVKPLMDYTTEYNRQEAAANDLMTKAAILETLSPDIDKAEYDSYKSWLNELKAASDALAVNGLNPQLRSTLTALNNRYSTEYAPLEDKLKTRGELIKEQRAYQQKNPNAFFDVDYSETPLGQISPSSTYTSYNPDSIISSVGNDVYNKLNAGEQIPSAEEYMEQYGSGLTDPAKIARVQRAISTGASLGSSTYQQKEFENYINKIKATRTGSSGSRGTGTGSSLSRSSSVQAYDGHSIIPSYDKKAGKYTIKNKDNQTVVLPDGYSDDDVLSAYYGGEFNYITAFGDKYPAVVSTQSGRDGQSRQVYKIQIGKNWIDAPRGAQTTALDLYNMAQTKDNKVHDVPQDIVDGLAGVAVTARSAVGSNNPTDIESNNKFKRGKWTKKDMPWREAIMSGVSINSETQKAMQKLEDADLGVTFDTTVWFDETNRPIGWKFYKEGGEDLSTPVFPKKASGKFKE